MSRIVVIEDYELGPVEIKGTSYSLSEHYVQIITEYDQLAYVLDQIDRDAKLVFASPITQLYHELYNEETRRINLWR
jgi:hypothetical protein